MLLRLGIALARSSQQRTTSRSTPVVCQRQHARWLGTKRGKKKALAAAGKKSPPSSKEEDEIKPFFAPESSSPPPPTTTLQQPPSSTLLIRTDLEEHLDWIESQKPTFDPDKPPPSFAPDPSGIVQRDLTEAMINLTDIYDSRIHASLNDTDDDYEAPTPLSRELEAYIAVRGAPMTVAEYMRQALTHPVHGYYTNPTVKKGRLRAAAGTATNDNDDDNDDWDADDAWQDDDNGINGSNPSNYIIGSKGDFVTAPEVSQVFGECLCVWFITQWQQVLGSPTQVQLVEVGPGRGTLISDIVTSALNVFTDFGNAIQRIHLVEASPAMRLEQKQKLEKLDSDSVRFVFEEPQVEHDSIFLRDKVQRDKGEHLSDNDSSLSKSSDEGNHQRRTIVVRWHDSFESVMRESTLNEDVAPLPTMVICQEFIDALPVHVFEKTNDGWRERMVDIASRDENDQDDNTDKAAEQSLKEKKTRLRYVLSPDTTPALRTLLNVDSSGAIKDDDSEVGSIIEVCPQGILLVQDIAHLLTKNGGSALIVDYGQEGSTDSIRAFSRHQQVNVLSRPGEIDVTADVDFAALRHAINVKAADATAVEEGNRQSHYAFGPITQGQFLMSMGAAERVSNLIENENTTDEQAEDLYNALERLVLPEQMGERYQVMAIAKKKDGIFEPPGF